MFYILLLVGMQMQAKHPSTNAIRVCKGKTCVYVLCVCVYVCVWERECVCVCVCMICEEENNISTSTHIMQR